MHCLSAMCKTLLAYALKHAVLRPRPGMESNNLQARRRDNFIEHSPGSLFTSDVQHYEVNGCRLWLRRVREKLLRNQEPAAIRHCLPDHLEDLHGHLVPIVVQNVSKVVNEGSFVCWSAVV